MWTIWLTVRQLNALADKVVYTGPMDAYFDYRLGALQYRSVRFETEVLDTHNYQGNAVVNYTDAETPYTRIIEHKHFEFGTQPKTVISREYSAEWKQGRRAVLPGQRREERCSVRRVQAAGRRRAGCDLRRPPGRIQVLRHGQGHRGGTRCGAEGTGVKD